jgi:hypothetical protein
MTRSQGGRSINLGGNSLGLVTTHILLSTIVPEVSITRLARHHVSRSIVLPGEELPFRRLNGPICLYCGSLYLTARNSYVERHPIFQGSAVLSFGGKLSLPHTGSLLRLFSSFITSFRGVVSCLALQGEAFALPIPGRYSVCSPWLRRYHLLV